MKIRAALSNRLPLFVRRHCLAPPPGTEPDTNPNPNPKLNPQEEIQERMATANFKHEPQTFSDKVMHSLSPWP